jgi:hypothetical protein
MNLDASRRLGFAVGVAPDMRATIDDQHPEAKLFGNALCDRESEEAGADDDEIGIQVRAVLCLGDGGRAADERSCHPNSHRVYVTPGE